MSAGERVARGAKLLDWYRGLGWERGVNLHILNMNDPWDDILGQLYGDFETGCRKLQITPRGVAQRFGFDISHEQNDRYVHLLNEWRRLIEARLKCHNLSGSTF